METNQDVDHNMSPVSAHSELFTCTYVTLFVMQSLRSVQGDTCCVWLAVSSAPTGAVSAGAH